MQLKIFQQHGLYHTANNGEGRVDSQGDQPLRPGVYDVVSDLSDPVGMFIIL